MLVLSRKPGESIVLGNNVTVTVVAVHGRQVKLAFDAPAEMRIWRGEIFEQVQPDLEFVAQEAHL